MRSDDLDIASELDREGTEHTAHRSPREIRRADAERLAAFIREHGHECHTTEGGSIRALETGSTADGRLFAVWVEIATDAKAVRNWLGY